MKKQIIFGIILAVSAYILSIISEATQDSAVITSYVTGGFELIFYLIAIPLIFYAGKKIRKTNTGNPGLRLVSWIMYGVAIPHALLFFNWGLIAAGNNRIPNGQIPVNSVLFFVAAMLMIADAWNSYKNR
jgi:hypothetical protein|tara:strand:- start:2365 stop:2754 length:390 start_codon:yes stop_codon:yes gene_type:complete